ncbi:MAG: N-acetylmuramoyl-L-alanine amidase, partial [Candidatus Zixiibacteriota bacterium]
DNGAFLAWAPLDTAGERFAFQAVAPSGDTLWRELPLRLPQSAPGPACPAPPHPRNCRLPARITFTLDHTVLRTGPEQAYALFPPSGTVAWADTFIPPYYRVRLEPGHSLWVEEKFVALDTLHCDPPRGAVSRVRVTGGDPWVTVAVGLDQPLLFSLEEGDDPGELVLDLFGAQSRLGRVDYASGDPLVREIRWEQIRDGVLRLEIFLNAPLWGYGAVWEKGSLALKIRRPPEIQARALQDRIIVLDPGHGGAQPGAVGPTRLAEKEPNLKLALALKDYLERKGARVFLTRTGDTALDLYARVDSAVAWNAEILLSLHNNALSDGVNPFMNHGSAVYYFQPQSLELARTLHRYLLAATDLPDHGFYYQNLALARPTEMLAALIECAFMMYPEEEMLLRDDEFLRRTAAGLAQGLEAFLAAGRTDPH